SDDISRWIERVAEVQSQSPQELEGFAKVVEGFVKPQPVEARHQWNMRQTYIALGQFMTSAAVLGIDTCPLEGIDPAGYDEILGLGDSGYATSVACVAGYRDPSDRSAARPKARFIRDEVIDER
ncbi:MAG: nitroreductase family protein, partial [Verrucomicrobiota bacterium]